MLRKIALLGAGLFVVGAIGTGVSIAHYSLNSDQTLSSYNTTKTLSAGAIKNLSISMGTGIVNVRPYDGKDVRVHLYGNITKSERNRLHFQVGDTGGTADIEVQERGFFFNFDWLAFLSNAYTGLHLDISVPRRVYDDVSLDTGTGTADIAGIVTRQTRVNTGTGQLIVNNVRGKLNLQTGTGELDVHLNDITDDVEAQTGTGEVQVSVDQSPKNLRYNLDTGIGDISFNLLQAQSESNFHGNLQGQFGTGGPILHVSTGTGSITVEKTGGQ